MGILSSIGAAIASSARALGNGLRFTGNAFANVMSDAWVGFNHLWDWTYERTEQIISLPRRAIFNESGGSGAILPPPDYSADVREARRSLRRQVEQNRHHVFEEAADSLGRRVWDYAAAPISERMLIDLDKYPLRVSGWITKMSGAQLNKLATAGPDICERLANGERPSALGLSGVPKCEAPAPEAADVVRDFLNEKLAPGGLTTKPKKKGGECRPD